MADDYASSASTTGKVGFGNDGYAMGLIETSGDSDWFAVPLVAGHAYKFYLVSSSLDPYLELYSYSSSGGKSSSGSGSKLASNNDVDTSSSSSVIAYSATTSGTYYLAASDNLAGTGNYALYSYDMSDYVNPTVSSFSPSDGATGVAVNSNIVLTFNETIQRGTGNIVLKNASGTTIETFDAATSSRLSISGSTLTIDPTSDLANSTDYYVTFASGSIKDSVGNVYTGTTSYDFTTVAASSSSTTTTTTTTTTTSSTSGASTAKIYLGTGDTLKASSSNVMLYGSSDVDTVTISAGALNVSMDQNVDRIIFPGASSDYTFKQSGIQLNVYDSTGATLLAVCPLQGDADGSLLSFSDGSASAKMQSGGIMKFGGATVSSSTVGTVWPSLGSSITASSSALSTAKAYLESSGTFNVGSSGMTIYGSNNTDSLVIGSGVTNVTLDSNVESVSFSGAASNYTFKQSGIQLNVYDSAGTTLLAVCPLQGDADGTALSFSDMQSSAKMQTGGVMKLGSTTISSSMLTTISSGATAVAVSGSGSSSAASGNTAFTFSAGTYTYSISGFGAGDTLSFPSGNSPALSNSSFTDGSVGLTWSSSGQTVTVQLSGLTNAQDSSLFGIFDFNTVFGSGTISSGSGSTAVAVSAAGSASASGANYTYTFSRSTDYTYTISNFAAGDKIVGPTGGSAVSFGTSQTSYTDGTVTLVYALAGQTVNVTLTGLTAAQDGQLMSPSDLNTVFGTGTLS